MRDEALHFAQIARKRHVRLKDLARWNRMSAKGKVKEWLASYKKMFGTDAKPLHAGNASAHGLTAETLDWCLERGLIDEKQHWCGIHLRWLYTLRYGAPGIRALDLNEVDGLEIQQDDPKWRELREAEYHTAMQKLSHYGFEQALTSICIYNERPHPMMLIRLRDGLECLVKHWKR